MVLPRGNRIIDQLVKSKADTVLAHARVVTLDHAAVTTVHSRTMQTVDFPTTALLAVIGTLPDGSTAEITTIGSEGFVEIDAALHHDVAMRTSICQFPGEVVRIPVADFKRGLEEHRGFADAVYHAVRARAFITEQLTLCGVRHTTEQRLARWLLLTMYRLTSDSIPITQDALSGVLGTRRASVSIAAKSLLDSGAIRYTRGNVAIHDRDALLARSCPCYEECRLALDELH